MDTITLAGRYKVGAVLYFRDTACTEQAMKSERRAMTAEQVAALTVVRVIEMRPTSVRTDDEDGSMIGCDGVSVCERVAS